MPDPVMALTDTINAEPRLPIWLIHIWQRLQHQKLGLILGAGVSIDAGCPTWEKLIRQLIRTAKGHAGTMKAHKRAGLQPTYITQILYLLHQERAKRTPPRVPIRFELFQIDSTWREIVYKELYRTNANLTAAELVAMHPYLSALAQLVSKARFAVNFNFDDIVDEATINFAKNGTLEHPEIISHPKIETRPNAAVIYHINGYLPRARRQRRSEKLVFTEDAFADVLVSPASHEAEFILSRFATTTFLLLGTSLNDNSLKNMLRGGMKRNPANHHYIIYWEDQSLRRTAEERRQIFNVNLDVYNLISIFMTTSEIVALIQLLNREDDAVFEKELLKVANVKSRRRYYLVGSIVSGKSTNLEALRCFTTFEEWSERAPEKMYQDHATLTTDERNGINSWLYSQLREKNDRMREAGVGIHIMDRGYLDLFAFSKSPEENLTKLDELRSNVCGISGALESGQILFLHASESVLSERQARRGQLRGKQRQRRIDYDGKKLAEQAQTLEAIYQPPTASKFDTSEVPSSVTSRCIAREILMGTYEPFDFEKRIDAIKAGGGNV